MATHQPAEPSLGRGAGPAGRRLAAVVAAGFLADLPAPSRDPGEIHRAVNEVLARREFRSAAQPLLDRIWTWIVTSLGELLAELTASTAGSIIGLVVFLVILAVLGVLAVRFVRTMSRSPEVAAAIVSIPQRRAAEWRAEAEVCDRAWYGREPSREAEASSFRDLAGRVLARVSACTSAGCWSGS